MKKSSQRFPLHEVLTQYILIFNVEINVLLNCLSSKF